MKVLAFSLYGQNPIYWAGMVQNVALAPHFYPGWQVHVWAPSLVQLCPPFNIPQWLYFHAIPSWLENPMAARLLAADLPGVEVVCWRDADSRLGVREARAVEAWLASAKGSHLMRDHRLHYRRVLGGMWGTRNPRILGTMADRLERWQALHPSASDSYGADEDFLEGALWPLIYPDCLQHDSHGHHFDGVPFPDPAPADGSYIGEKLDTHGNPVAPRLRNLPA